MLRQSIQPCRSFAAAPRVAAPRDRRGPDDPPLRPFAAAGRILLAPFAALGAALAGLVFLVLLPICGIASLAEGFGSACWRAARAGLHPASRGIVSRD